MRENGFYWVRHKRSISDEFEIGCFVKAQGWIITGCEDWFDDSELDIDERRIDRDSGQ